jgi:ATP-dependent exoDNAse (exonuclease V) beta subunit
MTGKIHFISAGAGSGKTFGLTELLYDKLAVGGIDPAGVIATTFTKKAATELRERVRESLIAKGEFLLANGIGQARIGTVNSICGQLVQRFAFEVGLPPELEVLDESEANSLLREALDSVLDDPVQIDSLNQLAYRLGEEDWQGQIKKLVDLARSNDIEPAMLAEQGGRNASDLLDNHYPRPAATSFDEQLITNIEAALPQLEVAQSTKYFKATATCIGVLEECLRDLKRGNLPWSQWVKLGKILPAKVVEFVVEPVQDVARRHDEHPGLHADIREWLASSFSLAANAMAVFARLKRERGVIDFVDQELLLLQALRQQSVEDAIRDELELLMVDEFQDTSPIQLALFSRLALLAKETVWVGDVKQAIYGFRGSDTALMQSVLDALPAMGATRSELPNSYRSRPELVDLVDLVNAVFEPVFAGFLQPNEIRLTATRPRLLDNESFAWWHLAGGNKAEIAKALGTAVRELLASGYLVVDKQTKLPRAVQPEDIAILSRSNDGVSDAAKALAEQGLPVAVSQAGLLATPEAVLAVACLRRLNDRRDTLASAEIISLTECSEPEDWLADRLRYLEAIKADGGKDHWREEGEDTSPVLARLAALRKSDIGRMTPTEALRRAIVECDLPRYLIQWSKDKTRVDARLANLQALRDLAQDYEQRCHARRRAATISGLILWFQQAAADKTDLLASSQEDAVRVLTHHGAKGLEWPVVICLDLHAATRDRLWDISVQSADAVTMADPLKGRDIRYWPWPYGKQSNGIPTADRISDSAIAGEFALKAREEAQRLLYVSMTRARDLLVFAIPKKTKEFEWLDCLNAPWLKDDDGEISLPDCEPIKIVNQTFDVPLVSVEQRAEASGEQLYWFEMPADRPSYLPAICSPSGLKTEEDSQGLTSPEIAIYGERIALNGAPDMATLGEALHACIAFDWLNPELPEREERIAQILVNWGVDRNVDAKQVATGAKRFREWCIQRWEPNGYFVEYPVEVKVNNGQRMKGRIDLLLETKDGWVILDHKNTRSDDIEVIQRHMGQLIGYRDALGKLRMNVSDFVINRFLTCEIHVAKLVNDA